MSQKGFLVSPKKWLGNVNIIKMDWDAKAMHMQLLCYAYQQEPQGYLIEDTILLRKLLENPSDEIWERVHPQIMSCWKSKNISIDGVKQKFLYNPDMIKYIKEENEQSLNSNPSSKVKEVKTSKKKNQKGVEFDDNPYDGFDLKSVLSLKPAVTILFEKGQEIDKKNIWDLGVSILETYGDTNAKARGFLSRLVKQYGEQAVSTAIAKLSINQKPIVEIHSYLTGILQTEEKNSHKKTGRSFVI